MKVQFYIGCTTQHGKHLDQGALFRRAAHILKEEGFPACTGYKGYGHWNGQFEETMILEVVSDGPHGINAHWSRYLAQKFCTTFDQESVLVRVIEDSGRLHQNPTPPGSGDDDYYPWLVVGTQENADAPTQYYAMNALTGKACPVRETIAEATQDAADQLAAELNP